MTQALGWEMFSYPTTSKILQASNSKQILLGLNPVVKELSQPKSKVFIKLDLLMASGHIFYLFQKKTLDWLC
jgi:hypothetical protein